MCQRQSKSDTNGSEKCCHLWAVITSLRCRQHPSKTPTQPVFDTVAECANPQTLWGCAKEQTLCRICCVEKLCSQFATTAAHKSSANTRHTPVLLFTVLINCVANTLSKTQCSTQRFCPNHHPTAAKKLCYRCATQKLRQPKSQVFDFVGKFGSGGGTRTPDTRIMIPLL